MHCYSTLNYPAEYEFIQLSTINTITNIKMQLTHYSISDNIIIHNYITLTGVVLHA